jgi:hypothetical protein
MLVLIIISFAISIINKHKEEIKAEAMLILKKRELDSIKLVEDSIKAAKDSIKVLEDSLKTEFENKIKNLELLYQKQIFEKFPFKDGRIPYVNEVQEYFSKEGEFYKFIDLIDTISDDKIKFNKKALAAISNVKNNVWNNIPVSITIQAPKIASVKFGIDSIYTDIERGGTKTIETTFPQKTKNGIEIIATTANNTFKESIGGEWSLLKIDNKHKFSFMDKSYLVDVELSVQWFLPINAIKPNDWFKLRLEPSLIQNFRLTNNLGG